MSVFIIIIGIIYSLLVVVYAYNAGRKDGEALMKLKLNRAVNALQPFAEAYEKADCGRPIENPNFMAYNYAYFVHRNP